MHACISDSKKPNAHGLSAYFTSPHGKVYQFTLMEENVHRDAHAFMFAPSALTFS